MANKLKTGLDYFPVDIDIYEDDKIIPLLSEHGAIGEAIHFRLLSAIYRNGHFIVYSEKLLFKLSYQMHIPKEKIQAVVETLVKSDFFDKDSYDNNMVLTSKGIQKRYQIAARRRKATDDPLMYWLLTPMIQDHNVPESDNADNMSTESDNMHDESSILYAEIPQRREKEKRKETEIEKENKEKEIVEKEIYENKFSSQKPLQKSFDIVVTPEGFDSEKESALDISPINETENNKKVSAIKKNHQADTAGTQSVESTHLPLVSQMDLANEKVPRKPKNLLADKQVTEIYEYYKQVAINTGLYAPYNLTASRQKAILARITEHGLDTVKECITTAGLSPFLTGQSSNNWKAGLDWMMKPQNFIKIIEGQYNNLFENGNESKPTQWEAPNGSATRPRRKFSVGPEFLRSIASELQSKRND